ncbi:hypothetical protein PAESOLCIP111_01203 [Paenibacillus solanacearum]|uniref:Uncharacterized protein n=1 Tax=Paenibacillus solanacearum TaxID=2048548 RepID=A0A916JWL4_9BACL|nr:hypothetical protein [Paenibacillus solanacearum]CAG7609758.1 hypothetical protein PAESOLCIP111_01203 [Paenibacillus solanacearum]
MNSFRFTTGVVTSIFGMVFLATLALFLLITPAFEQFGHGVVSLVAVVIAELGVYLSLLYVAKSNRRAREATAARFSFVTLAVLYGVAVIVHMLLFWILFQVSFFSYGLIHVITFALWMASLGVSRRYNRYVEEQEEGTAVQTQLMKQMRLILHSVGQQMSDGKRAGYDELQPLLHELIENMRYSDPVSDPSMMAMEENLLWQIQQLQRCVGAVVQQEGDSENLGLCRQLIQDISADLAKRNAQLISVK